MDANRESLILRLKEAGYALAAPALAQAALGLDLEGLERLRDTWERLPRDSYLRDGGRYRYRRHSCYVYTPGEGALAAVAHRPHWQPTAYNALHGGLERWFEPLETQLESAPAWRGLLGSLGGLFAALQPVPRWHIEAHQFRIDTTAGIGRPTPEGAHRDGVDFVAVILVARRDVRGGETHVFEASGSAGVRFLMEEPWTLLLLDDARVVHETTPIQPTRAGGVRDTLVLTYRARGFQQPEAPLQGASLEERPSIQLSSTLSSSSASTRFALYPGAIRPQSCPMPRNCAGHSLAMLTASSSGTPSSATALRTQLAMSMLEPASLPSSSRQVYPRTVMRRPCSSKEPLSVPTLGMASVTSMKRSWGLHFSAMRSTTGSVCAPSTMMPHQLR
jgi:hypothetical protein